MSSSRPSAFTLTSAGPLRLYSTRELIALPPPQWQIHSIVPSGGLVGLYGPPGCGKSFVAIDMSLCIATGRPWQGFAVQEGHVLYVGAEGGTGIGKRVVAWLQMHGLTDAPRISWMAETLSVTADSEQMDALFDRIRHEAEIHPTFIVIDTLARCFDGNENEQEDMGRFVAGVDRMRREFGATVLIVHHTRLDGERERGNTAFRGAADAMLQIKKEEDRLVIGCNKQKDDEEFPDLDVQLQIVPVIVSGVSTTSCILAPAKEARDTVILDALAQAGATEPRDAITFAELLERVQSHMSRATLARGMVRLAQNDQIIKENGKWRMF